MQQRTSSEQSKKRRTEHTVWIDARSAIAMFAAVGTIFCACLAVDELDKQEAANLAAKETVQQTVVLPVEPTPEADKPIVEPEVETVTLWDVPLEDDLQLYIVQACEEHHTDPAVVIAMIERESSYRASVIGDNGNAFGLMQIWPRWHQDRMDKYGVTDLLEPFQNVTVGMDYLFELLDRDKGLAWALAAYNQGPDDADLGYGFDYAAEVLAIKENLKGKVIECVMD